eukprot:TRINITY_DN3615_c0_g5_i1.p1 TRINITY_DN3615_c0_g5~~TRINITY_DN3615_c0_g5_i1.p1  ORF type:complete len:447 (+),score=102.98 TRINITY_DN3615_c0_g5_i1:68-1342(+)
MCIRDSINAEYMGNCVDICVQMQGADQDPSQSKPDLRQKIQERKKQIMDSSYRLPALYNTNWDSIPNSEKKWLQPGTDITDYFNYGLDEKFWKWYVNKVKSLNLVCIPKPEKKSTLQLDKLDDKLPIDLGGFSFPPHFNEVFENLDDIRNLWDAVDHHLENYNQHFAMNYWLFPPFEVEFFDVEDHTQSKKGTMKLMNDIISKINFNSRKKDIYSIESNAEPPKPTPPPTKPPEPPQTKPAYPPPRPPTTKPPPPHSVPAPSMSQPRPPVPPPPEPIPYMHPQPSMPYAPPPQQYMPPQPGFPPPMMRQPPPSPYMMMGPPMGGPGPGLAPPRPQVVPHPMKRTHGQAIGDQGPMIHGSEPSKRSKPENELPPNMMSAGMPPMGPPPSMGGPPEGNKKMNPQWHRAFIERIAKSNKNQPIFSEN